MLVDGVTKLDKVKYGESAQAETVRKMIVAMSRDIRVLLIKLADRLHNARTWGFVPPEKAQKKATETLEIYAPLAHRLGIQTIKSELEDLSFAVLHPKLYAEIESLVKQRTPQREQYVQSVIDAVDADLRELRIRGRGDGAAQAATTRSTRRWSCAAASSTTSTTSSASAILVGSVRDCYAVLGAIHARWTPLPGRFKDYIATPKFNLYQSLHTTVIGPGGRTVEIQIRTQRDAPAGRVRRRGALEVQGADERRQDRPEVRRRRHGVARAHLGLAGRDGRSGRVPRLAALRDRRERGLRLHAEGPRDRTARRRDARSTSPTPCTPRSATARWAPRSTAASCRSESELKSGDVVEVFTSKNPDAGPSQDWLELRQEHPGAQQDPRLVHEGAPRRGHRAGQGGDRPRDAPAEPAAAAADEPGLVHRGRAVAAATRTSRRCTPPSARATSRRSRSSRRSPPLVSANDTSTGPIDLPAVGRSRQPRDGDSGVLVRGAPDILVKLAKCCTPVPGDEIVGFVTRGSGVSVHRADCTNVKSLDAGAERLIEVEWAPTTKSVFLVQIQVEALDRSGLLSDVTRVLSEHHVNILSATVSTTNDRLALSRFVFEMGDIVHLDRVLNAVRRIDAVYDVYRVTSS